MGTITPAELISGFARLGIDLRLSDDGTKILANPAVAITPAMRESIIANKGALVDHLWVWQPDEAQERVDALTSAADRWSAVAWDFAAHEYKLLTNALNVAWPGKDMAAVITACRVFEAAYSAYYSALWPPVTIAPTVVERTPAGELAFGGAL